MRLSVLLLRCRAGWHPCCGSGGNGGGRYTTASKRTRNDCQTTLILSSYSRALCLPVYGCCKHHQPPTFVFIFHRAHQLCSQKKKTQRNSRGKVKQQEDGKNLSITATTQLTRGARLCPLSYFNAAQVCLRNGARSRFPTNIGD